MDNEYNQNLPHPNAPDASNLQHHPVSPAKHNGFATASLVLGILAFLSVFTMTVFPAIILGGLSIILGLLSRGGNKMPGGDALTGIIISASSLVINLVLCITAFLIVFSDPEMTREYWKMVGNTYEQMTGIELDEVLKNYGITPEMPEE